MLYCFSGLDFAQYCARAASALHMSCNIDFEPYSKIQRAGHAHGVALHHTTQRNAWVDSPQPLQNKPVRFVSVCARALRRVRAGGADLPAAAAGAAVRAIPGGGRAELAGRGGAVRGQL